MKILDENLLREFLKWVEARYYDAEQGAWTRNQSDSEYLASTRDYGNSLVVCDAIAGALMDAGHHVEITGAESEIMQQYHPDSIGLDWMVVDNRYVLDPWGFSCGETDKIIFDSHDPEDSAKISKFFPPRDQWEKGSQAANVPELAQDFQNYLMPRRVVDELMGDELSED